MTRRQLEERQHIEGALEDAQELGNDVAEYREETGHIERGDSFEVLKHAEAEMGMKRARTRLQFAYDRHGADSDLFRGHLHTYLTLLAKNWYQKKYAQALKAEFREDLATDLWLKMIDPANKGQSIHVTSFLGAAPVHHWVHSVFRRFMAQNNREQTDDDFKHFRLVGDNAPAASIGDIRVGQVDDQLAENPEPEQKPMVPANLASLGTEAQEFAANFAKRDAAHFAVVNILMNNADYSGADITRILQRGFILRVGFTPDRSLAEERVDPINVSERTVQRIIERFYEGLLNIGTRTLKKWYPKADLGDREVLADKFWRSRMARAAKPKKRYQG